MSGGTEAADGALKVVETGWSTFESSTTDVMHGMVLNNSDDRAANNVTVKSRYLDAAGDTVADAIDAAGLVLPGQTIALGNSGLAKPDDVDSWEVVEILVSEWVDMSDVDEVGGFEVRNVTTSPLEGSTTGGFAITGEITSTFAMELHDVQLTALFRDDAGEILGGKLVVTGMTVPPTAWAPVEAEELGNKLDFAEVELYPRISSFTKRALAATVEQGQPA